MEIVPLDGPSFQAQTQWLRSSELTKTVPDISQTFL